METVADAIHAASVVFMCCNPTPRGCIEESTLLSLTVFEAFSNAYFRHAYSHRGKIDFSDWVRVFAEPATAGDRKTILETFRSLGPDAIVCYLPNLELLAQPIIESCDLSYLIATPGCRNINTVILSTINGFSSVAIELFQFCSPDVTRLEPATGLQPNSLCGVIQKCDPGLACRIDSDPEDRQQLEEDVRHMQHEWLRLFKFFHEHCDPACETVADVQTVGGSLLQSLPWNDVVHALRMAGSENPSEKDVSIIRTRVRSIEAVAKRWNEGTITLSGICTVFDEAFLEGPQCLERTISEFIDTMNLQLSPSSLDNCLHSSLSLAERSRLRSGSYCGGCSRVVGVEQCRACGVTAFCTSSPQVGCQDNESYAKGHGRWCRALKLSCELQRLIPVTIWDAIVTRGDFGQSGVHDSVQSLALPTKGDAGPERAVSRVVINMATMIENLLAEHGPSCICCKNEAIADKISSVSSWSSLMELLACSQHGESFAAIASPLTPLNVVTSDLLSPVMTLADCIRKHREILSESSRIVVHVVGADRELNRPWPVIGLFLPNLRHLEVVFIGPELDAQTCGKGRQSVPLHTTDGSSGTLSTTCHKSFYHEFVAADTVEPPDIVMLCNAGIHHYDSWQPTLKSILGTSKSSPIAKVTLLTSWAMPEAVMTYNILRDAVGRSSPRRKNLSQPFENEWCSLLPRIAPDNNCICQFNNKYVIEFTCPRLDLPVEKKARLRSPPIDVIGAASAADTDSMSSKQSGGVVDGKSSGTKSFSFNFDIGDTAAGTEIEDTTATAVSGSPTGVQANNSPQSSKAKIEPQNFSFDFFGD